MNAVAKQTENNVVAANAASIMDVISRAASDPSVDVDKLERLLGMAERIGARDAEIAYNDAMSAAQAEMEPVRADASNPQTKSRYASFIALDRALRPIYTRHGFSLSFDTADGAPVDHVRVVCKVSHRAGHSERPHIDMPSDGKGAKGGDVMTKTHATGAAMTYGQRYLLKMIFNIAVGEDDDGNRPRQRREQSAAVEAAIAGINACNGLAELKAWKANNASGLSALDPEDHDTIVRHFTQRYTKAKGGES